MPSNFDCALATAHGYLASILIESGLTGFVTSVRGLCSHPVEWRFSAVPIAVLLKILPESETAAYGRKVPMIPCADVDLKGSAYRAFAKGAELVRAHIVTQCVDSHSDTVCGLTQWVG